jgi:hypothetical protein
MLLRSTQKGINSKAGKLQQHKPYEKSSVRFMLTKENRYGLTLWYPDQLCRTLRNELLQLWDGEHFTSTVFTLQTEQYTMFQFPEMEPVSPRGVKNMDLLESADDKRKLQKLHERISKLRFLDPACGCGNFLIVAYRELRELEMEIIKQQLKGQTVTDISTYFTIDVDRFYGIEYEEFPAQIAQVAMWLMDHQMNMKASETFGDYYVRLTLRKSATIVHGNALRIDWQSLIEPMPWEKEEARFDYILGNPPFVGSKFLNEQQRDDMLNVASLIPNTGTLDYVIGWYAKAIELIKGTITKVAFVSTNSITQGEQVINFGSWFISQGLQIFFAHRTFQSIHLPMSSSM